MDLFVYLLPFAILLGIFSTYSDIKYSKIKNYLLLFTFGSVLIINLVFAFLIRDYLLMYKEYYFQYFISVLFMFLLSLVLWISGYWNAADSKLMTVFSMLITPGMIRYNFSNLYIVNFFYNVIFISFIFVIAKSAGNFKNIKDKMKYFRKITLSEMLILFVIIYSFSYISNLFFFINNGIDRIYITVIFTILFFNFLRKLKLWYVVLFISVLINTFVNLHALYMIDYWKNLVLVFIFVLTTRILMEFLSFSNVDMVKINDLKTGQFLAQELIIDSPSEKTKKSFFDEIQYDLSMGLNEKNIKLIKAKSHLLKEKNILISRKDPFAPYVFIGFILTLAIGTNIVTFIRVLIG